MTGDQSKERRALNRLADALVDDVLNSSDEEVLAEAEGDGIDAGELAEQLRGIFERTVADIGKEKLAAARQGAANARQSGGRVVRIDRADARRRYEAMIAEDPGLTEKLTLAARKGEGQSERDVESAIDDLTELGAFDEEDDDA